MCKQKFYILLIEKEIFRIYSYPVHYCQQFNGVSTSIKLSVKTNKISIELNQRLFLRVKFLEALIMNGLRGKKALERRWILQQ